MKNMNKNSNKMNELNKKLAENFEENFNENVKDINGEVLVDGLDEEIMKKFGKNVSKNFLITINKISNFIVSSSYLITKDLRKEPDINQKNIDEEISKLIDKHKILVDDKKDTDFHKLIKWLVLINFGEKEKAIKLYRRLMESSNWFIKIIKVAVYIFLIKSAYSVEMIKRGLVEIDKELEENTDIFLIYYFKGLGYYLMENYKKAIEPLNKFEELSKKEDKDDLYMIRGNCYYELKKYDMAIKDLSIAIDSENEEYLLQSMYYQRGISYFRKKLIDEAVYDFEKIKDERLKTVNLLTHKGICYYFLDEYKISISCFDKVIEINPKDCDAYDWKSFCLHKLGENKSAKKNHKKAVELGANKESFGEVTGIKKLNIDILISTAHYYFSKNEYDKMYKYLNRIEYYDGDETEKSTDDKFLEMLNYYDKVGDFDKEIKLYSKISTPFSTPDGYYVVEKLDNLYSKQKKKIGKIHKKNIMKAKVEERNKIIADLSHSIKNMLGTVIDPLENLKHENKLKPKVIDNAIRGANLIRQIVNAMNLSFKGSYKDFIYDTKHNKGEHAISIQRIIIESLKHSLSNMFDSKYFGNFMRNYFPNKKSYYEAKSQWKNISDSIKIEVITKYIKKYFFDTKFDLNSANEFIIGNEKGSAIKLQILFQEIIFNAVKYTGFVDRKNRLLKIKFSHSNDKISFIVKNSYKPSEKTKTTGLGHVVIENFAKLLRTKPQINKSKTRFSLLIKFNNFWDNRDELFEVVKKMEKKLL